MYCTVNSDKVDIVYLPYLVKKTIHISVFQKNKIRVGWGRAVDNLDCLEEAK